MRRTHTRTGDIPAQPSNIEPSLSAEKLLHERQAAEVLAVTTRALQAWRYRGGGPIYVQLSSRAIRYRRRDLDAWINQRLRNATSEY